MDTPETDSSMEDIGIPFDQALWIFNATHNMLSRGRVEDSGEKSTDTDLLIEEEKSKNQTCSSKSEETPGVDKKNVVLKELQVSIERFDHSSEVSQEHEEESIREEKFSSENLFFMFCGQCCRRFEKIPRKKLEKCPRCNNKLMYVCALCIIFSYQSHSAVNYHLKYDCLNLRKIKEQSVKYKKRKTSLEHQEGRTKKEKFSSENLFFMSCVHCKRRYEKIPRKKLEICPKCKRRLIYVCAQCITYTYHSHSAINYHLKNSCKNLQKKKEQLQKFKKRKISRED